MAHLELRTGYNASDMSRMNADGWAYLSLNDFITLSNYDMISPGLCPHGVVALTSTSRGISAALFLNSASASDILASLLGVEMYRVLEKL